MRDSNDVKRTRISWSVSRSLFPFYFSFQSVSDINSGKAPKNNYMLMVRMKILAETLGTHLKNSCCTQIEKHWLKLGLAWNGRLAHKRNFRFTDELVQFKFYHLHIVDTSSNNGILKLFWHPVWNVSVVATLFENAGSVLPLYWLWMCIYCRSGIESQCTIWLKYLISRFSSIGDL